MEDNRTSQPAIDFDAWPVQPGPVEPAPDSVPTTSGEGPSEWSELAETATEPVSTLAPIRASALQQIPIALAPVEEPAFWGSSTGGEMEDPESVQVAEIDTLAPTPQMLERVSIASSEPVPDVFDTATPVPREALTVERLPAPRVWFTMPAELRVEGYDQSVEGAVLNLSQGGLALTTECELTPGQRIWTRFRLGFIDEPNDYLCAVAWRRSDESGNVIYGCEFSSLSDAERVALQAVVAARSNGIVTEWTTPDEKPALSLSPAKRRSTRMSWLVGVLAGVLLAGGIGPRLGDAVASISEFAGTGAGTGAEENAVDTETPSVPKIRVARDSVGSDAEPELVLEPQNEAGTQDAAEIATDTPSGMTGEPSAAPSTDSANAGTDTDTAMASSETISPSSASPAGRTAAVEPSDSVKLIPTSDGVEVSIQLDGTPGSHSTFWLENPRRFVVDVAGGENAYGSNRFDLAHPIIHRVRVGQHPDKVRFVLDVAADVQTAGEPMVNERLLTIPLQNGM